MAECYNKLGKPEKASEFYYKVMESGLGAFSEIATLNYGLLSYQLERFQEAAEAFETLDKIAQLENNKAQAKAGLIKSYFMCRNYRQTLIETDAVLSAQSKESQQMKQLAEYYKAKSHIALGEREKALELLKKMAKIIVAYMERTCNLFHRQSIIQMIRNVVLHIFQKRLFFHISKLFALNYQVDHLCQRVHTLQFIKDFDTFVKLIGIDKDSNLAIKL